MQQNGEIKHIPEGQPIPEGSIEMSDAEVAYMKQRNIPQDQAKFHLGWIRYLHNSGMLNKKGKLNISTMEKIRLKRAFQFAHNWAVHSGATEIHSESF